MNTMGQTTMKNMRRRCCMQRIQPAPPTSRMMYLDRGEEACRARPAHRQKDAGQDLVDQHHDRQHAEDVLDVEFLGACTRSCACGTPDMDPARALRVEPVITPSAVRVTMFAMKTRPRGSGRPMVLSSW